MEEGTGIDFEAEGLLEGVSGEAREARVALLEELAADGVELEELREAVSSGRLALLPVERALSGEGPRYTAREVAEASGVELSALQSLLAAIGVSDPGPDVRVHTQADVEAAKRLKAFLEIGLPEEGVLRVARTIGMATARIAEANRELVLDTVIHPGDNERDIATRLAVSARQLMPLVGPTLGYALQVHLIDQIRHGVIGAAEIEAGRVGGAIEASVCFADIVGFTQLGEEIEIDELASVAGRFEGMAAEVAQPPVRLVKMIGDAAMLVSTDPPALMDAALQLHAAAAAESEQFPQLRVGVAHGSALNHAGDWYGRPVNLASRITGVARRGSVLADEAAKEAAGDGYHYSFAGEKRLKGIDSTVKLFRVRREPKDSARGA
jgi:adenylate cyclase